MDDFEKSVQTLNVTNAIDHRKVWFELLGMKSNSYKVEAIGNDLDIIVDSSSEFSDFVFSKEQKQLSFNAEGENGTLGLTVIPVGKLLEGSYVVTIDGKEKQPGRIFDDQVENVTRMEVQYDQGFHDIVITGRNVVPEFPAPILWAIAAALGISTLV